MKKILKSCAERSRSITMLSAVLLMLAGGLTSCKEKESEVPFDISFMEYSLSTSSTGSSACQWTILDYYGEVIIVNSNEDLKNVVECIGENNYQEIDFSKHTLLLVMGMAPNDISDIKKSLRQLSMSEYSLNIEIHYGGRTTDAEQWTVALIIDKIGDNSKINLNVVYFGDAYLIVDRTSISATAEAGTYSAMVHNSPSEWSAVVENAEDHTWCTLIQASGTARGNSALTLNLTENTTSSERSAVVKITSGNLNKILVVNQYAKGSGTSFTDYSLEGTSCQWKKFRDGDYSKGYDSEVIIINSDERLASYVECVGENNYPKVDFSKYTLLLARGVQDHLVRPDYKEVQHLSSKNYVMKVDLKPYLASVITWWQVPIVITKIADDSEIELIVTKNP